MKVTVHSGPQQVAAAAADLVAEAVAAQPDLVLGLPTGRTAVPFYDQLAQRFVASSLDLSRAWTFNLDELGLPEGHPSSFRRFMERYAGRRIGLDPHRCEIPSGSGDLELECRRYDQTLNAAGGLDLAILGVGADGHVAYNLPGAPEAETHVVTLPAALADRLSMPEEWRPPRAVTMGLGTLKKARRLLLMATGAAKAEPVKRLRRGPADPQWPCTFLRDHPRFEVMVDLAADGGKGQAFPSEGGG